MCSREILNDQRPRGTKESRKGRKPRAGIHFSYNDSSLILDLGQADTQRIKNRIARKAVIEVTPAGYMLLNSRMLYDRKPEIFSDTLDRLDILDRSLQKVEEETGQRSTRRALVQTAREAIEIVMTPGVPEKPTARQRK